jgi:hypothetical protein
MGQPLTPDFIKRRSPGLFAYTTPRLQSNSAFATDVRWLYATKCFVPCLPNAAIIDVQELHGLHDANGA